jgi:hypothetical protein
MTTGCVRMCLSGAELGGSPHLWRKLTRPPRGLDGDVSAEAGQTLSSLSQEKERGQGENVPTRSTANVPGGQAG